MFPPTSLNQAVYGGGGNRTRDGFPHKPFSGARYVYFIQCGADGPIKIGIAQNPEKRRDNLQSGNPERLYIRALIRTLDPESLETKLHERFRQHRLRGEWFSPTAVLLDLVAYEGASDAEARAAEDARVDALELEAMGRELDDSFARFLTGAAA